MVEEIDSIGQGLRDLAVPQDSVLSSLLVFGYINDLVEGLAEGGFEVSAFADDLAVWVKGKQVEEWRR